jgi:hypothetical protein
LRSIAPSWRRSRTIASRSNETAREALGLGADREQGIEGNLRVVFRGAAEKLVAKRTAQ